MGFLRYSTFITGLLSLPSTLIAGQLVHPGPLSDCKNLGTDSFLLQCKKQPGCCHGNGFTCCAGGCCSLDSVCVNVGLPNEGCCPPGSPNLCGGILPTEVLEDYKLPCASVTSDIFQPMVSNRCFSPSEGKDWYCPLGNFCGLQYPSCYDFSIFGCESSPPEVQSVKPTPTPPPSGTTGGGRGGDGSLKTTKGTQTQSAVGGGVSSPPGPRPFGAGGVLERNVGGILGGLIAGLGLVF